MLLDMYLYFCLPLTRPIQQGPKAKAAPRRRRPSVRAVAPSRPAPRRGVKAVAAKTDKPSTGARRPAKRSLRVLDGGRAGLR
ncbi:hypothetical protein [Myxococcus qinghaiensis]|uniref:hypothetical protein n=1 Tax=Myxococcus qinghaiensis TaxID=2906758 RepID=UPI0020A779EB|nr:hypothetical protein [Myxococcus qinghaiensis]MCP3162052.1 hypothetical protein [Myxococcus qinghaiensis]